MNCEKCGKKISVFTDNSYNVVVDGKGSCVCEECYNKFYSNVSNTNNSKFEEKQKTENVNPITSKTKDKVKNHAKTYKNVKGTTAFVLRIISTIIIIAAVIGGGIAGYNIGYDEGTTYWGHEFYYEYIGLPIGMIVGFVAGYLSTIFIRYFAELGENIKKTADATSKQAYQEKSETEQIMMYKELLDSGAITQDEFDKKKKELLNL